MLSLKNEYAKGHGVCSAACANGRACKHSQVCKGWRGVCVEGVDRWLARVGLLVEENPEKRVGAKVVVRFGGSNGLKQVFVEDESLPRGHV
jgi:hypothetical protein